MKNLTLLLLTLMLLGCSSKNYEKIISDNIIIHKNKRIPSNKDYSINLEEKFVINAMDSTNGNISIPFCPIFDNYENLYIVDSKTQKIHKFNLQKGYLKSFGGRGQGPGEFGLISYQMILNDTLFVFDRNQRKINKFSLDGTFLYQKQDRDQRMGKMAAFSNKYIISPKFIPSYDEKRCHIKSEVVVESNKFHKVKSLLKKENSYFWSSFSLNILDYAFHFCASRDKLYIGKISSSDYTINVYDKNLIKTEEIRKGYIRKKIDDKTRKRLATVFSIEGVKNNLSSKYQKAINGIWIDKFERIWVLPGQEQQNNEVYFDIFKDGIYLNSVKFKELKFEVDHNSSAILIFSGKYLIITDPNSIPVQIKVYDYDNK